MSKLEAAIVVLGSQFFALFIVLRKAFYNKTSYLETMSESWWIFAVFFVASFVYLAYIRAGHRR